MQGAWSPRWLVQGGEALAPGSLPFTDEAGGTEHIPLTPGGQGLRKAPLDAESLLPLSLGQFPA